MTTRTCPECKAPLPAAPPGQAARCSFCGAEIPDEALSGVMRRLGVTGPLPKRRSLFPLVLIIGILAMLSPVVIAIIRAFVVD